MGFVHLLFNNNTVIKFSDYEETKYFFPNDHPVNLIEIIVETAGTLKIATCNNEAIHIWSLEAKQGAGPNPQDDLTITKEQLKGIELNTVTDIRFSSSDTKNYLIITIGEQKVLYFDLNKKNVENEIDKFVCFDSHPKEVDNYVVVHQLRISAAGHSFIMRSKIEGEGTKIFAGPVESRAIDSHGGLTELTGENLIVYLKYNSDGAMLAVARNNNTIYIYDTTRLTYVNKIKISNYERFRICKLKYSSNNKWLLIVFSSQNNDKYKFQIYDTESYELINLPSSHCFYEKIIFSPDSNWLAAICADNSNTAYLWHLPSQKKWPIVSDSLNDKMTQICFFLKYNQSDKRSHPHLVLLSNNRLLIHPISENNFLFADNIGAEPFHSLALAPVPGFPPDFMMLGTPCSGIYKWPIGGQPNSNLELLNPVGVQCMAMVPNSTYLLIGEPNQTSIFVQDIENKNKQSRLFRFSVNLNVFSNDDEIQESLYNIFFPINMTLELVHEGEDCFFHAVFQAINKNKIKITTEVECTVEMLKLMCDKLNLPDQQNIIIEQSKKICRGYGIKIHILEVQRIQDSPTIKLEHRLIAADSVKEIDESEIDYKEDAVIHIVFCQGRYVPVLNAVIQENEVEQSFCLDILSVIHDEKRYIFSACSDQTIHRWIFTERYHYMYLGKIDTSTPEQIEVKQANLAIHDNKLVVCFGNTIILYNVMGLMDLKECARDEIEPSLGCISRIVFSNCGIFLFLATNLGSIIRFKINDNSNNFEIARDHGKVIYEKVRITGFSFLSIKGNYWLIIANDQGTIKILKNVTICLDNSEQTIDLDISVSAINLVTSQSGDEKYLAVSCYDGYAFLYRITTQAARNSIELKLELEKMLSGPLLKKAGIDLKNCFIPNSDFQLLADGLAVVPPYTRNDGDASKYYRHRSAFFKPIPKIKPCKKNDENASVETKALIGRRNNDNKDAVYYNISQSTWVVSYATRENPLWWQGVPTQHGYLLLEGIASTGRHFIMRMDLRLDNEEVQIKVDPITELDKFEEYTQDYPRMYQQQQISAELGNQLINNILASIANEQKHYRWHGGQVNNGDDNYHYNCVSWCKKQLNQIGINTVERWYSTLVTIPTDVEMVLPQPPESSTSSSNVIESPSSSLVTDHGSTSSHISSMSSLDSSSDSIPYHELTPHRTLRILDETTPFLFNGNRAFVPVAELINEDCFFHAVAQALNQLNSITNPGSYNVVSLRKMCSDYAKTQETVGDSWLVGILWDKGHDISQYIEQIKLRRRGSHDIEGVIICKLLKITMHIIKSFAHILVDENSATEQESANDYNIRDRIHIEWGDNDYQARLRPPQSMLNNQSR